MAKAIRLKRGYDIALREVDYGDLEFIRNLRNEYSGWFFDDGQITKDQQEHWFDTLPEGYMPYVIVRGWENIGFLSVRKVTDDVYEVGNLMIHPMETRKGYMTQALKLVFMTLPVNSVVYALVKVKNVASLATFYKVGFVLANVAGDIAYLLKRIERK